MEREIFLSGVRGVIASLGVKGVIAGFGLLAKCIAKLLALTPRFEEPIFRYRSRELLL